MKKLLVSLLSIALIGCSIPISNNTNQYSDLDKEYSHFKTEALTQSYLKKKMDKWLSDGKYSKNLVREIEYAKFKHKDLLKNIVALQPTMFDNITANTGVNQKRVESPFETYIQYIDPYPSSVTANSATNITATSFTANWESVSNATSYKLFVDGNEVYSGTNTNCNVTGLTANLTYTYYVKAVNSAGQSPNSNTISINLNPNIPAIPTATSATNLTQTSFKANWTSVSTATSYKLTVDNNAPIDVGNVTSKSITGLTSGTTHTYSVQAVNSSGTSDKSNNCSVILLAATPTALKANNITQTSFTANWASSTGATSYKLYLDGVLVYTGTNLSYDKTNAIIGSSHQYYVKAVNDSGESSNSNTIKLSTFTLSTFQTLSLGGVNSEKYFEIGTDKFLATAVGSSSTIELYKWNGTNFSSSQSLTGNTGIHMVNSFTIGTDNYLIGINYGTSSPYSANSKVYKFNTSTGEFDFIQNILSYGGFDTDCFQIDGNYYLVIANAINASGMNLNSFVYKWNGSTFDWHQTIATKAALGSKHIKIGNNDFLAFAFMSADSGVTYNTSSPIYKWNTSTNKFENFQGISTYMASSVTPFQIGTDYYLAYANRSNGSSYLINSYIYKWNGTNFSLSQNIPTLGGFRFDYFEIGGDKYLGVANNRNNSTYSVNSYIYKYNPSTSLFDTSSVFINIPSLAARSIEHFSIDEYDYIFVSNTQGTESTIYKLN